MAQWLKRLCLSLSPPGSTFEMLEYFQGGGVYSFFFIIFIFLVTNKIVIKCVIY